MNNFIEVTQEGASAPLLLNLDVVHYIHKLPDGLAVIVYKETPKRMYVQDTYDSIAKRLTSILAEAIGL